MLGWIRAAHETSTVDHVGVHRSAAAGRGRSARRPRGDDALARARPAGPPRRAADVEARGRAGQGDHGRGRLVRASTWRWSWPPTIAGEQFAQTIQLLIEYDPQPPFDAGSPDKAPAEVVQLIETAARPYLEGAATGRARARPLRASRAKSSCSPVTSASSSSALSRWPSRHSERSRSPASRRGEPLLAEALAQDRAQVRLERPGAQVVGRVVAGVDVGEVGDGGPVDADRVAEQARVERRHLGQRPRRPRGGPARSGAWPRTGAGTRACSPARRRGRPPRPRRPSRSAASAASSVRCSNRNAKPSVTELSPRWRNSKGSVGSTFA